MFEREKKKKVLKNLAYIQEEFYELKMFIFYYNIE